VKSLEKPRTVWLMLPAGETTERALGDVASLLAPGDAVIDGGNTFWKDDLRRAACSSVSASITSTSARAAACGASSAAIA
jgi:6-phosphogluconate dehydrogenase (decarboxylating)